MSFWDEHGDILSAVITLVVAVIVAKLVDVAIARQGRALAKAVSRDGAGSVAETRLRLLRRLVTVAILLVGVALALRYFSSINKLATGILASSAIAGLVVGIAARQVLANAIAGIQIAITQPIRIGDTVTWDGERGDVVDIGLSYTSIRREDGSRMIVANDTLASGTIINHTL